MIGKIDVMKGRIKEAAGVLVDDEALRDEGKADQIAGKAREVVEDTVQGIREDARKTITEQRVADITGKLDIAKGRIKEATGVLVGDMALRNEGKADQNAGKAREVVEGTVQKIKEKAQEAIDTLNGNAD